MPSTEQTWRNQKLLHVVFGVSSLLMLGATIWMLAADHIREWKDYQRQFNNIEVWNTEARIHELDTVTYANKQRELEEALAKSRLVVPPPSLAEKFVAAAEEQKAANEYRQEAIDAVQTTYVLLDEAAKKYAAEVQKNPAANTAPLLAAREKFLAALTTLSGRARFTEDELGKQLKAARAGRDVEQSRYSIGVEEGASAPELAKIQEKINKEQAGVDLIEGLYQQARAHRTELDRLVAEAKAPETAAQKELEAHLADFNRLKDTLAMIKLGVAKNVLTVPIIDAFNSPLKIEQVWLPHLTLNNNFRDVARFDRCITCHKGIDKTAPGSPSDPGYPQRESLEIALATPSEMPAILAAAPAGSSAAAKQAAATEVADKADQTEAVDLSGLSPLARLNRKLEVIYGFRVAEQGMINPQDITIDVVWPETPAAMAGLRAGDTIRMIADARILDHQLAERYLLDSVTWGQPVELQIDRGTPHPFSSHPRLDLFVGSMSPHKIGDFGCTICHDGQGSATTFKWASHTPNSPRQASDWTRDHGWFDNHHWILPMQPQRFAESTCLKCHHDMMELEPSERFPDPPAPNLMAGFHAIREYGCFGCHEINGYDSPTKRRGPDIRLEPAYTAAAQQLLAEAKLTDEQRAQAEEVVAHPDRESVRTRLANSIKQAVTSQDAAERPSATTLKMADLLGAREETPGEYRKVGPSLRHLGSKVEMEFLYNWIREPKDFRPSTKMPQFFGLWSHLLDEELLDPETGKLVTANPGLEQSKRFEPLEIRALALFLLEASQPFAYLDPPAGVTTTPDVERGKVQFELRGCLACHQHPDFPQAIDTQGPNLANMGAKLPGENGRRWLYSWVRAPNRYHVRTVMPDLFLEPIHHADGSVSDPAADITAYLLSQQAWQAEPLPAFDAAAQQSLDELVAMYLQANFSKAQTKRYVKDGIPGSLAGEISGDESLLVVGENTTAEDLTHKKLLYLGKRTAGRLGCAGCHDIPGFEDSKPIGTGLADWGRKEPAKLAFEQIIPFLERTLGAEYAHGAHGAAHGGSAHGHAAHGDAAHATAAHGGAGHHGLDVKNMPADVGFFVQSIEHHQRTGFLWQKLREPRSYDYRKTENRPYTDRLRMPQFTFNEDSAKNEATREAVMTFVLGLVAEPPAERYVYQPTPRNRAIQDGLFVLTKYNCAGCHTMEMQQWAFDFVPFDEDNPASFQPPIAAPDYPFLEPYFTPEQLARSKKVDIRGLGRALVTGRPNPEVQEDPETGEPLNYFELWHNAAIDGHAWASGSLEVPILESKRVRSQDRPQQGGMLADMLHGVVLKMEQRTNPNAKASDAWGWVPPPLVGEGRKVQTQWLYDFLLDPHPIRPAVVLRMPRFNMSSAEAAALVNYFAAKDGVDYPYEFDPRTRTEYLKAQEAKRPDRMKDALRLVTDSNYCVKCHLVGDFTPDGSPAALAPQLANVSRRLRPEFVRDWIANPKRLLPYTGMPQNFPIHQPASQELFAGSSEEQLQAVVDLLLNWASYLQEKTSIRPMVKLPPPAPAEDGANQPAATPSE